MGQKQDELLKRIQKLVRKNQDLYDKNEKLQKAVTDYAEQNENLKLRLKDARLGVKEERYHEGGERFKKYKMATVLFAYISGFKHLTDHDSSEVVMDQLDEVLIEQELELLLLHE